MPQLTVKADPDRPRLSAIQIAALALAYGAAALLAIAFSRLPGSVANVWIANALALAVALKADRRSAFPLLAAIGLAGFAANLACRSSAVEASLLAAINTAEVGVSLLAIRGWRLQPFQFDGELGSYLRIQLVAAMLAPIAGALLAAGALHALTGADPLKVWMAWWAGDALGALVILPIGLVSSRQAWAELSTGLRPVEFVAWLFVSVLATYLAIVFVRYPFLVVALPLLVASTRASALSSALLGAAVALTVFVGVGGGLIPDASSLAGLGIGQIGLSAAITAFIPFCVSLALNQLRLGNALLTASESRWAFALQSARQGVWDRDVPTDRSYFSSVWKSMLGYEDQEVQPTTKSWLRLIHPDDVAIARAADEACLSGQTDQFECEFRMRHKNGSWVSILDRGKVIERDETGRARRMIGTHTDISKQKEAGERLALLNQRIQLATKAGNIGIWELNTATDALWWDGRMHTIFGTDPGWFNQRKADWTRLIHPDDRAEFLAQVEAVTTGTGALDAEFRVIRGRGADIRNVRCNGALLDPTTGRESVLVGVCWDITEQKVLNQRLTQDAGQDPLTGLPNRKSFELAVAIVVTEGHNEPRRHAVCHLDLDHFKMINDRSGHGAGDAFLNKVATIIRRSLGSGDLVARLGGDQFGILLRDRTEAEAIRLGYIFIAGIALAAGAPGREAGQGVGASIGIVVLDGSQAQAADVLTAADQACSEAKRLGRSRVYVAGVPPAAVGNAA